jgi:hypothetical protein
LIIDHFYELQESTKILSTSFGGETKKQQTREKVAVAQYKEPIKFTYKNLK